MATTTETQQTCNTLWPTNGRKTKPNRFKQNLLVNVCAHLVHVLVCMRHREFVGKCNNANYAKVSCIELSIIVDAATAAAGWLLHVVMWLT